MRYMLLIHSNEIQEAGMSEEAMGKIMAEYYTFTEELMKSGALRAGDRLRPTTSATTVRVRNGDTLTTDGPFAETKEQFGGYYLIDVPDLDEAIRWASKIPSAKYGCVEVRPIWEMEG
ncbi:MAG: YciI family protein [Planctomycetes bacterium]|nr:YciI family protein [Planctomycetota bacterium]